MKPSEVIAFAKNNDCKFVDYKFIDLLGAWQHTTVPIHRLTEEVFEDGLGFDGSSIRGWQPINASDMAIIPEPGTAKIDPFHAHKTLSLVCRVVDPITGQSYGRDPRGVARKAENHLKSTGIADTAYFGPEAEFFVFDSIRYGNSPSGAFYEIDSDEAIWNSSKEGPNLGHRMRHKEGYFPVPPNDTLHDLRAEMMTVMMDVGIEVELGHHEVATAGQCELGMRFSTLTDMGDQLMWYKYVVKNVAKRNGKTATFMPKPLFGDNGSGMHTHQSLWKNGQNLFAGDGYAGLSDMGLFYMGGILKHAKALAALTNPTTNSYRRLVPGYEAPVNLAYSSRNRSASIRIPVVTGNSSKARRIEVRFPDATANAYLAFSAMLMAGLDGVMNRIDPGDPLDKDIYALSPEELKEVPHMPGSLDEALLALEADHEFLLRGDVFTRDLIETWISEKRERELDPVRLRPVPYEFYLYYDV
jgi:glutamine synthetase